MTSDKYVPFEIQSEIIKRVLPVRSLIRFRSVSKQWKSLIESSEFITQHSINQTQLHNHLLVRCYDMVSGCKYVSIVDDDSFPRNKFSPVVSPTLNLVNHALMFDSSYGLVCLYGRDVDCMPMIVIWNPSIGKSVGIRLSVLPYGSAVGFGVCPKTRDPKVIKIIHPFEHHTSWTAEVFTLSIGVWRSISMNIHLSRSTEFKSKSQVVIDGVIYWATYNSLNRYFDRIISFDLKNEEFGEVHLPNSFAIFANRDVFVSKLKESLVVLHADEYGCDVWMMKNGFVKLFSVSRYNGYISYVIIGFRRNGQPIRECRCPNRCVTTLEAFEPSTEYRTDLGIDMPHGSVYHIELLPCTMITSYTESLLLLNHSNSIIQGY